MRCVCQGIFQKIATLADAVFFLTCVAQKHTQDDMRKKIIAFFIPQQGCRQTCIFCHQPHLTGVASESGLSPDMIRQHIEQALQEPKSRRRGVRFDVAFYGGSFTGLPLATQERWLQTVQPYVQRGDLDGIRLATHPTLLDAPICALLAVYPITLIELGVQSFDDEVLRRAGRGHTAQDAAQTIRRLQELGIPVGVHLMVGLPGDSPAQSLASAAAAIALNVATVRLHPTLIIRGAPLERLYQQGGYVPLTLDEAVVICKTLLQHFRRAGIPVIRIGLQPSDSLTQHVVAGPYHPAFGQLVEAAVQYDEMAARCRADELPGTVAVFAVAPADLTSARGQQDANLRKLQAQFHFRAVQVVTDARLPRGVLRRVFRGRSIQRPYVDDDLFNITGK